MSSASPKIPKKVDLIIVGSGWEAKVAAELALSRGLSTLIIEPDLKSYSGPEIVYVGNGEIFERAILAFGDKLGNALWDYSERNLALAQRYAAKATSVVWHLEDDNSRKLGKASSRRKNYYHYNTDRLEAPGRWLPVGALKTQAPSLTVPGPVTPKKAGVLEYEVSGVHASVVLLLDDRSLLTVDKQFTTEIIPVTLSVFEAIPASGAENGYHLFNGGADYVLCENPFLAMGSFRNLFADKGVGFQTAVDPVSRENLFKYFSAKGWIAQKKSSSESLKYVSLSCDGLPVVGNVPGQEGIFYASGFSGRTANFIFAVLEDLLSDIALGRASRVPDFLSNRRFI